MYFSSIIHLFLSDAFGIDVAGVFSSPVSIFFLKKITYMFYII